MSMQVRTIMPSMLSMLMAWFFLLCIEGYPGTLASEVHGSNSVDNTGSPQTTPDSILACSISPPWEPIIIENGGDNDNGGKGVLVENGDSGPARWFHFYHNSYDNLVFKSVKVQSGETVFVTLCDGFEGRVQRGTEANWETTIQKLGTWGEFSFDEEDQEIWGNISLLEGCDGGVEIMADDDSGITKGFTEWILDDAPSGAVASKQNGSPAIDKLVGDNANQEAIDFIWGRVDPSRVDISNDQQTAFRSGNMRMKFVFHRGSY